MALGRQHCRPGCIYSLRPAGIKVRINGSFILFSLQGAGIYVLVPRGLGRGGAILSGRAFKIEILKISRSALAAEICTGRTIVCCGASIVAHFARKVRATNTQRTWPALWGITLLGFQLVLGRHNIRPPHFASKVSYSAWPQGFAKCPRSAPCSGAATAILFGQKLRRDFS